MKQGRTLQALMEETVRQAAVKRDFIADTRHITMVAGPSPRLQIGGDLETGINPIAHGQIAEQANIPKSYYDRMMADAPELLANNVNTWFNKYPAQRMVRTLDGRTRALMSNSYRPLDNVDLLEAAVPPLLEMGVEVMSCEVTDQRLYLKVVDSRIKRDLPDGVQLGRGHDRFDTVSPALVLSNSEVGWGALAVQTSVWTGGCSNLVVIQERSTRKFHVGTKTDIGDEVYRLLSDQTRKLTDAALWSQIGDVVRGAFEQAQFDAVCEKIAATAQNKIEGDPVKVVELTAKKYSFNDVERGAVLRHLIQAGSLTQYGLHAAITRTAEDLDSYDRASDFERIGGKVIELPRNEWRQLAEAA